MGINSEWNQFEEELNTFHFVKNKNIRRKFAEKKNPIRKHFQKNRKFWKLFKKSKVYNRNPNSNFRKF